MTRAKPQGGKRGWTSKRDWSSKMTTCRNLRYERVDNRTQRAVCTLGGERCNYACCPKVKKYQQNTK